MKYIQSNIRIFDRLILLIFTFIKSSSVFFFYFSFISLTIRNDTEKRCFARE